MTAATRLRRRPARTARTRPTSPTPAVLATPAPAVDVPRREHRSTLLPGESATADCGCAGIVNSVSGGTWPAVGLRVLAPCPGCAGRVAVGVILHLSPGQVHATTPDAPAVRHAGGSTGHSAGSLPATRGGGR